MRAFERLFRCGLALVLAIPCGALALTAGPMLDPGLRDALGRAGLSRLIDAASGSSPDMMPTVLAALAQGLAVLLILPPVLAAALGETLRLRALAWYGGASACLTALLPWLTRSATRLPAAHEALAGEARLTAMLFVTGAVSGLVYWFVAGRSAAPRMGADA